MSDQQPDKTAEQAAPEADPAQQSKAGPSARAELEEGLAHLGRAFGGVATRLFGSKVTGIPVDRDTPSLSPEADAAVTQLGESVGRILHAVGEGLVAHPGSLREAQREAERRKDEPLSVPEGEAPLLVGLRSLAEGIAAAAGATRPSANGEPASADSPAEEAASPDAAPSGEEPVG